MAAILEKSKKNRYISDAVRAMLTKFGLETQLDHLDRLDRSKFEIKKIPNGSSHHLEK